jgi:hypothetical protein
VGAPVPIGNVKRVSGAAARTRARRWMRVCRTFNRIIVRDAGSMGPSGVGAGDDGRETRNWCGDSSRDYPSRQPRQEELLTRSA